MYEGFHILHFVNGDQCLNKAVSYKEQASLAYGADWCRKKIQPTTESHQQTQSEENHELRDTQSDNAFTDLVATCSFYDHALNLWKVKL